MENKTITGKIQEKTNNSLKVNNFWIKFFQNELIEDLNVNDTVNIIYVDNKKDNKLYHNGKEVKLVSENKVNIQIPDTTVNTIIMSAVNIYNNPDNALSLEEITKKLVNSYKIIIS